MLSPNSSPPPFTRLDKEGGVDWEVGWRILYRRRWFLLTTTAVIFVLSSFYVLLLPNVYTAQTGILVERMDSSPLHYKELLLPPGEAGSAYYETRVALLQSLPILGQTVEQLNLVDHYQRMHRRVKTEYDAVRILKKNLRANIYGRTQIIRLSVKDVRPEMAAKIADTLSEIFVRESWRERLFISEQLLQWFPNEAKALQSSSPIQQLQKFDKDEFIASLPSIVQDPVIDSIKQERIKADAQFRELSRRYTGEHPKMKELRARLDYLESEMKAQIEKTIAGLKAGLSGEFSATNIKIVEHAVTPTKPSGPHRLLIVLACTFLGLAFSMWLAILFDYLNRMIRSEEDVRALSLPFLGYFPLASKLAENSKNGRSEGLVGLIDSDPRLLDDITNIQASVLFSMPADRGKFLMCTSASPEEGKTTVVSLLGISLAESGRRVLLIDADLRNPSLHKMFGKENHEGLSTCLVGAAKPAEVIHAVEEVPGLHLMTAGKRPPNPTTLLESSALDQLLGEIALGYERILFDVPPALHIADALILAERMHGTLLVFQSEKIHQNVGKRLIERLNSARGFLIGAVINRAEYQRLGYRYYRHYRQYGKYYHRPAGSLVS